MSSRDASASVVEGQVRAAERRLEVRPVRGEALAVDHVDVVPAGAFHGRAVEVVRGRVAQLEAGVDERLRRRVGVVLAGVRETAADRRGRPTGTVVSSWFSSFWKYGSTSWYDQPVAPPVAQPS